ncbi:hypothetical protein GLW08_16495 [Pontibacillus yanchengensis]|uniref:Uncharacterized protein n=1 Tax=Pontibacillus yanchengensis TaxID=462910 RepID=A0ACC7VJR2_9BACI|nr:hypothetical protein [Pontibacillus yanchengensis]MYL54935.1 hypothetical protein [Pontibacillus yanchengensis]
MRNKTIISILIFLFISSLVACGSNKVEDSNGDKQEVNSVNVYKQEFDEEDSKKTLLFTLQKDKNKNKLDKFIKAANEVKYQTSRVDMPPSDYKLEFGLANNKKVSYSLWLEPNFEGGFIMEDSSHFAQFNQATSKELLNIINHK